MSELQTRFIDDTYAEYYNTGKHELAQIYLKSEADKVIAELTDKALQYKVLDKDHCRDLNTQERFFAKQIAYNKHKRCLAMAYVEWLKQVIIGLHPENILYRKAFKRERKWKELAEQFKGRND